MDTKENRPPDIAVPDLLLPNTPMATLPDELLDVAIEVDASGKPKPKKSPTPFQDSLGRFSRDKRAMASLVVIALFVVIAIVGPPIYQNIGGVYNSVLNGPVPSTLYHGFSHQELQR